MTGMTLKNETEKDIHGQRKMVMTSRQWHDTLWIQPSSRERRISERHSAPHCVLLSTSLPVPLSPPLLQQPTILGLSRMCTHLTMTA